VGDAEAPLQALIFDSHFDQYRGVVSSVRVMNGRMRNQKLSFMQAGRPTRRGDRGAPPDNTPVVELGPGEVGYLIAGIKDVGEARSGETVTDNRRPPSRWTATRTQADGVLRPVPGGRRRLRGSAREPGEAAAERQLVHLRARDVRGAGFGFRCGFLGLLHMEIVRERLEREFDLNADRHRAVGGVPGGDHRRRDGGATTRPSLPPPTEIEGDPRAVLQLFASS
jgi:GTP-binding protein LepA